MPAFAFGCPDCIHVDIKCSNDNGYMYDQGNKNNNNNNNPKQQQHHQPQRQNSSSDDDDDSCGNGFAYMSTCIYQARTSPDIYQRYSAIVSEHDIQIWGNDLHSLWLGSTLHEEWLSIYCQEQQQEEERRLGLELGLGLQQQGIGSIYP